MTAGPGPTIAIIGQAVRRFFLTDLARDLVTRYGATVHLYTLDAYSADFYRAYEGPVFASVNVVEGVAGPVPKAPADAAARATLLERAHDYEARYGRPLSWFRIVDRYAGLGYAPGGFHHPRSKGSEETDDFDVIAGQVATFDYWEREFRDKAVDILINGFYLEAAPAAANNVAYRMAFSARNENWYYWATDVFAGLEELATRFAETAPPADATELHDAPVLNRRQLDAIAENAKLGVTLRRMAWQVYAFLYWKYKRNRHKQYRLTSELKMIWRQRRDLRRLSGGNTVTAADLASTDYVFYALQVEPEATFQGCSPEYFYQLSAIISLSRDLPAGVKLVVKEHIPAAGRRPDLFYDQIALLKNVVFADVREDGLELVRNARAVAVINSTAGQEAATLGKPVLSFGRRNLYNILDHVAVLTREEDIAPAIAHALSPAFDGEKARRDGQRFLAALRSLCFDMADWGYHNPRGHTPEVVRTATDRLMESLGSTPDTVAEDPADDDLDRRETGS